MDARDWRLCSARGSVRDFPAIGRSEPSRRLWDWRFGESTAKRLAAAFAGGMLMMFGARLAQGCTSGHGISGVLQLALSSWIFVVLLFVAGVATTFALYGKEARNHV